MINFNRTDSCEFTEGRLPFMSDPRYVTYEPFKDYFGYPIKIVSGLIGDSIKILCRKEGKHV